MSRRSDASSFLKTVGTFVIVGPLTGTAVIWAFLLVPMAVTGVDGQPLTEIMIGLPGALLLSLVLGYLFGAVPAAITGMIALVFSYAFTSRWLWAIFCALAGFVVTVAGYVLLGMGMTDTLPLGAVGAVAGAVCALVVRKGRPAPKKAVA